MIAAKPVKKKLADLDWFLTQKRQLKTIRKKRKLTIKTKRNAKIQSIVIAKFGTYSKLITLIAKNYKGNVLKHNGFLRLKISESFSVIDNPEKVLSILGQFAKTYKDSKPKLIQIDHSLLTNYDLAANGILDLIVVEAKKETKLHKIRLRWSGIYPIDKDIRRFIRSAGIIKHLQISKEYPKENEAAGLKIFDARNHHYYNSNPTKADKKTTVTTNFVDHINSCLNLSNRELTLFARHKLCEYVGEILDNVEQHAGMVDWTIQGYLDNSCNIPICEIAIFNFGKTIAENLGSVPRDSYTWKQIGHYILLHRAKKFFGPSWSENDLLTLIALQEKVSSKNFTESDTRGNGTVDLIEFFQKIYEENNNLGEKRAKMAILSGNTHITFDGKYKLSSIGSSPRRIAFNESNNLHFPPDKEYVRSLKGLHFPGTIISIKFPLNIKTLPEIELSTNEN